MQSNKKYTQLGNKLPRGSKRLIARKTGLTYNTVCRFFNGCDVSFETEVKIVREVTVLLDLVKESNAAKEALFNYGT
ncbi:hypothetical protein [Flavobacterium johnsoniae]|uniref:XRE family transcriptional regulator n=1 Tax=Flavobacterium johnsoniae TaxID=986 RepID=A0A1M5IWX0_FLAJO|nr:hypothetical protein [Flavobacterium johnsoniae]SHG32814.1 hypothetical protein SAMN05444388_102287 [Flavobacterium johnsoniae]